MPESENQFSAAGIFIRFLTRRNIGKCARQAARLRSALYFSANDTGSQSSAAFSSQERIEIVKFRRLQRSVRHHPGGNPWRDLPELLHPNLTHKRPIFRQNRFEFRL